MAPKFREFQDTDLLTDALSKDIAQDLKDAVAQRDAASFVATGGTTAPLLYRKLSLMDAPWNRTTIVLSDERWVDTHNAASNEKMVRDTLLHSNAVTACLKSMRGDTDTPEAAVAAAHAAIAQTVRPFDVTLLGMGADMHAASLFPGAPGVNAGLDVGSPDLVCKIGPIDGAAGAETRLSLTLGAILASRMINIMIIGAEKRSAYEKALVHDNPVEAPVSAILRQRKAPVTVYWAP